MGFNSAAKATASTSVASKVTVDGYLNLYLSRQDSTEFKIGFIGLSDAKEDQYDLHEFIKTPKNVDILKKHLVMSFVPVNGTKASFTFIPKKARATPKLPEAVARSDSPKAYINLYAPRDDGSLAKLGFIALSDTSEEQKMLLEFVQADPEANLEIIKKSLIIKYNSAKPVAKAMFSFMAKA